MAEESAREGKGSNLTPADKLHLPKKARDAIDQQSRPNAILIHETIRAEGESELDRSSGALLASGFAAGLSMGLSLIVQALLRERLPEAPWRELLVAAGYTIGFLVVVLGRQQLFTENTLTPILPLLRNRDAGTLRRVLALWGLVLLANLVGTWLVAWALADTPAFEASTKAAFLEISRHAISSPFWPTLLKAIVAGWLIALMVWLLPAAETGRIWVILLITYVVGLGGLAHIIAGSVEAAYLVWAGTAGAADYVMRFFLPTLIGNVIGGVLLVAVLNYGQVAHEIED